MSASADKPVDRCPRCGEDREGQDPCPSCGYEARYPGVLASFREAASQLSSSPTSILPYVLPAALLTLLGGFTLVVPQPEPRTVAGATTVSIYLFLVGWWYLAALGETARQRTPQPPPRGSVIAASGVASALVVAPLSIATFLATVPPTAPAAGFLSLVGLLILLADLVVVGRVVGIPVQAGRQQAGMGRTVKVGMRAGKEHAGIGFVFLGTVLFVLALVLGAVAARGIGAGLAAGGIELDGGMQVALASAIRLPLLAIVGAFTGLAIVAGLTGTTPAPARTFACPRCGADASVQGGRARCTCGLEGPLYEA